MFFLACPQIEEGGTLPPLRSIQVPTPAKPGKFLWGAALAPTGLFPRFGCGPPLIRVMD